MPRAIRVIEPAHRHDRPVADTVILDYGQRSGETVAVTSVKGLAIVIDLASPGRLRGEDVLELDDGNRVEVVAAPEPLIEARAQDVPALARLAWHLGDRHVPVEVLPNRIRTRQNEALEALLGSLGAKVTRIEAPFEPEGGAYASGHAHAHAHHGHEHGHEHAHHDHACDHEHHHGHAHGHGHNHDH